jgi:hypothetical protein
MSKYAALNNDVYSVFSSVGWKAENIPTVPNNFVGTGLGTEYIRVTVIPSSRQIANFLASVAGVLLIDIFIPAGSGALRASQIADKLDSYLAGKTLKTGAAGSTQFSTSALTHLGADKDNFSLYRSQYTLPFNFFGV